MMRVGEERERPKEGKEPGGELGLGRLVIGSFTSDGSCRDFLDIWQSFDVLLEVLLSHLL